MWSCTCVRAGAAVGIACVGRINCCGYLPLKIDHRLIVSEERALEVGISMQQASHVNPFCTYSIKSA